MAASLSNLTVLIIDDQATVLDLISTTLRTLGVGKVIEANSAEKAKEIMMSSEECGSSGKNRISAVMSDIVLSETGQEGLELVKWIRENEQSTNRFVPIMMFSALASMEMVQRSRDEGVNVFMRKPFSVNSVANLLLGLVKDQRHFVETEDYFGPDRRRPSAQLVLEHDERRKGVKGAQFFEMDPLSKTSYSVSKKALSAAEYEFKRKTEAALAGLDRHMNEIATMSQQLGLASRNKVTTDQLSSINKLANLILDSVVLVRMNLGVFRVPIISDLSKDLSQFICQMMHKPQQYLNSDGMKITDRFINFIKISIKHFDDLDDSQGKVVVLELERVCQRFKAKYIATPLTSGEIDMKIEQSMQRIHNDPKLKVMLC